MSQSAMSMRLHKECWSSINNANLNDYIAIMITNEIHQNRADYSSFQIGPLK